MNRKKLISIISLTCAIALSCTGCSSLKNEMLNAMNNNQEIKLSVDGTIIDNNIDNFDWVELDQLKTYKNIRKVWDDKFQIVDTQGNWAGNNTLFNVFQNKVFVEDYWDDNNLRSELAQAAMVEFSDMGGESAGIIASVNAYFNLIPANTDGTSGLLDNLSRAEVMATISRGDTPVIFTETNKEFESVVGVNANNILAFNVTNDSYLKYQNGGLNYDTYNSPMTRIEAIYILMNRYFENEHGLNLYNSLTGLKCRIFDETLISQIETLKNTSLMQTAFG